VILITNKSFILVFPAEKHKSPLVEI